MVIHPCLHCDLAVFLKGVSRYGNNWYLRLSRVFQRANLSGRFISVHDRHLDIHQDDVIIPCRGVFYLIDSNQPVLSDINCHSGFFQDGNRNHLVHFVVFCQKHPFSCKIKLLFCFRRVGIRFVCFRV